VRQVLGDQTDEVVQEFASRAFRQLMLFSQTCGELVEIIAKLATIIAKLNPIIHLPVLGRVQSCLGDFRSLQLQPVRRFSFGTLTARSAS
jgi:hypothetical protein